MNLASIATYSNNHHCHQPLFFNTSLYIISFFIFVIVNCMCQFAWPWDFQIYTISGCFYEGLFLDEISIYISELNKVNCPLQCS